MAFAVSGTGLAPKLSPVTFDTEGEPALKPPDGTNAPALLRCYGRVGDARWFGGQDWGVSYGTDTCGDLTATSWPGLDSGLRIDRQGSRGSTLVLTVSVRPGLLHLAGFWFGDVAFAGDRREWLLEANGYLYLLDIDRSRLGTLAEGDRFILMTRRYEKAL